MSIQPSDDEKNRMVVAGARLLKWSHLIVWDSEESWKQNTHEQYTDWWRSNDAQYGRVIVFAVFAIGAEYFAKGVCLLNGIRIDSGSATVADPPSALDDIQGWARAVCNGERTSKKPKNLELKKLIDKSLKELAAKRNIDEEKRNLLIAGFELLRSAIRNRDLHDYVKDVREHDFQLAVPLLAKCLNILVECLPNRSLISD